MLLLLNSEEICLLYHKECLYEKEVMLVIYGSGI